MGFGADLTQQKRGYGTGSQVSRKIKHPGKSRKPRRENTEKKTIRNV